MSSDDPRQALARRLRELRRDLRITQAQLADVLTLEENASVPLISSWESARNPKVPPVSRLEAYATFFATERSVASKPYRLFAAHELNDAERVRRDELLRELTTLRRTALGLTDERAASGAAATGMIWRFRDDQVVTIVCSDLPRALREQMPYADRDSPDYVELYRYSDLDALLELYGHIRAVNPKARVNIRTASELDRDDYTSHLVLLGGVDWNVVTAELLTRMELPVNQAAREHEFDIDGFEVSDGTTTRVFRPKLQRRGGKDILNEDVAHFYRAQSPFNFKRTVTICNGMFARGTYGAVRALTDARFRDRNEEYLRKRFGSIEMFSIISRVLVVNGTVLTPDWTVPGNRLHEWPEERA